jgi:hypothetical protein
LGKKQYSEAARALEQLEAALKDLSRSTEGSKRKLNENLKKREERRSFAGSIQAFLVGVELPQQSDQLAYLKSFVVCNLFKDGPYFAIVGGAHQVRVKLEGFVFKGEHEANNPAHFFIGQLFLKIQIFQ